MENEYNLSFNQMFGFVLVNNRTRSETPLSDAEAIRWSKKPYVSVNLDADKRMDEILGFKSYGKTWRNVNINLGN
tara:strand:+ start:136 stop:360 length:225 start_codon:yes stop_codon:yes gene_type:complete